MVWLIVTSGIALLILLAAFIRSSACIAHSWYVKAFCERKDCKDKLVVLSYDDGLNGEMTDRIAEVLKRHGAKASFFVIGSKLAGREEQLRRLIGEGHCIGNHSYSHDYRNEFRFSRKHISEIELCNEAVYRACGLKPRFYRPPIGVTTPHLGKAARLCGMEVIGWSVRSFDTVSRLSRERVVARIMRKIRPGGIILMHDRCPEADRLTEMLLCALEKKGYRTVTLEELSGLEAYGEKK